MTRRDLLQALGGLIVAAKAAPAIAHETVRHPIPIDQIARMFRVPLEYIAITADELDVTSLDSSYREFVLSPLSYSFMASVLPKHRHKLRIGERQTFTVQATDTKDQAEIEGTITMILDSAHVPFQIHGRVHSAKLSSRLRA